MAGKKPMAQFWGSQETGVPSYLAFFVLFSLHLIGWSSLTFGRTICFTQSTNSHVNLLQKHFHRHTQNNVCVPGSSLKLTCKINHNIIPWCLVMYPIYFAYFSYLLHLCRHLGVRMEYKFHENSDFFSLPYL